MKDNCICYADTIVLNTSVLIAIPAIGIANLIQTVVFIVFGLGFLIRTYVYCKNGLGQQYQMVLDFEFCRG